MKNSSSNKAQKVNDVQVWMRLGNELFGSEAMREIVEDVRGHMLAARKTSMAAVTAIDNRILALDGSTPTARDTLMNILARGDRLKVADILAEGIAAGHGRASIHTALSMHSKGENPVFLRSASRGKNRLYWLNPDHVG